MNIADPSSRKPVIMTAFSHYAIARGHVVVWAGLWSRDRVALEIVLRERRAQQYITACRKRDFIRCACWTAAWCLFCWLV